MTPKTARRSDDTASDDGAATGDTGPTPRVRRQAATREPVTINWWHIQNNDPGLSNWQAMADEYMAMHPNVTIDINVLENEAFKAALQTNLQAGDVPDLFQSWGGGGLREQVEAGLVQDITERSSGFVGNLNPGAVGLYNVDGKQYGIPFNLGMVGFWYNKDLFTQAGIEAPPATWDEFLDVVQQLKDAGITPIAVGAGDKWPAHFYYSYLMVRLGGEDVMNAIAADGNFNVPEVIAAGDELKRLIDMEPFQPGFLAATWEGLTNPAPSVTASPRWTSWASGRPGAFRTAAGVPEGELAFELGWFPFPMVDGGAGAATDAFGGGDGFAVGKDAPPEAVEFLEFITNVDNAKVWGESGSGLPVTKGSEVSITDPNMQMVLSGIDQASFVQLYLDQFFTPDVGAAVNDAVQTLFAGTATSEEVASAITAAAAG